MRCHNASSSHECRCYVGLPRRDGWEMVCGFGASSSSRDCQRFVWLPRRDGWGTLCGFGVETPYYDVSTVGPWRFQPTTCVAVMRYFQTNRSRHRTRIKTVHVDFHDRTLFSIYALTFAYSDSLWCRWDAVFVLNLFLESQRFMG